MTNLSGNLAAADQCPEASAVAREVIREVAPRAPAATFIAIALELLPSPSRSAAISPAPRT